MPCTIAPAGSQKMKRSEMLSIIQQAIVDHNISIGDFEGYGAHSHELILERLEEAGMKPPSYIACMANGKLYNPDIDQGRDTIIARGWEPEDG